MRLQMLAFDLPRHYPNAGLGLPLRCYCNARGPPHGPVPGVSSCSARLWQGPSVKCGATLSGNHAGGVGSRGLPGTTRPDSCYRITCALSTSSLSPLPIHSATRLSPQHALGQPAPWRASWPRAPHTLPPLSPIRVLRAAGAWLQLQSPSPFQLSELQSPSVGSSSLHRTALPPSCR